MKISRVICDLCNNNREAVKTLKVFTLKGQVTRGAPKAQTHFDLCDYCYGEFVVYIDAMQRTAGQ